MRKEKNIPMMGTENMGKSTAKESILKPSKVTNIKIISLTVKDISVTLMVSNIKENGRIIKCMEKLHYNLMMEKFMKVHS